jgi:hypothetical protein
MADPTPEFHTWADVERALAGLPRRSVVAFAVRAAARVAPAIAELEAKYGPEAREWLNAVESAIRVVAAFARGEAVTRFTLDLAAEAARTAASATANAARTAGPSPLVEGAELAYAAAAYAADAARAATGARAAALAAQAARMAAGGGDVPAEQTADLRVLLAGKPLTWDRPPAPRAGQVNLFALPGMMEGPTPRAGPERAMSENPTRPPTPPTDLDPEVDAILQTHFWFMNHATPEMLAAFPGHYVAVEGQRILTSGDDDREVVERAIAMPGVNPNRVAVILVRPDPPEW